MVYVNNRLVLISFAFCIFSMLCNLNLALAQIDSVNTTDRQTKRVFSAALGLQHGVIIPHSVDVQNTSGANPTGIEVSLSWQRNDSASFALCHCYPRQGLMLSYFNYDVALLGQSLSANYFIEPTYRLNDRLFFFIKAAAGLSYLNNPYDSVLNPTNQSYSTAISVHLLLGTGLWIRLSDQWWINPNVNFQHISNGGMSQPNKGINWPTAGVALSYQPTSPDWYRGARSRDKFWREKAIRYDFTVLTSLIRGYDTNGNRKRFFVGGLALQAGKQLGKLSMLTMGMEVFQNNKLENRLERDQLDFSPVKAGVLVGHEFLLGRFLFSQRLGVYVFDQTPYYDRLYHRWGLKYRLTSKLSIGGNLMAHRHVAEFIDFRLTYSFQKK